MDDCIDFAKTYSASNPNAALMVILPVHYGTVEGKTVVKNRRLLEDKLFARLTFIASLYALGSLRAWMSVPS